MTQERRVIEAPSPFVLRNMPLRPRAWQALVDVPDALHVSNDDGEIILVHEPGVTQIADTLTKALPRPAFRRFCDDMLGVPV